MRIRTTTGEYYNADGVTESLSVDINGHICNITFVVLCHVDHDALLGLDWFELTNAGIYPKENILRFPSEVVHLDSDEYYVENDNKHHDLMLSEVAHEFDDLDIEEENSWQMEKDLIPKPVVKLSIDELKMFNKLLTSAKGLFASDIKNLGSCSVLKHKIRTRTEEPIRLPPYRKSQVEREFLNKELDEMLAANIIRKSRSPWSAPVIVVPKKDGSKRICIDYRKLNAITVLENWPLPSILDILDRLSGSIYFSTIDLKSGYWQVLMDEESIEKTAFTTPDGHFEFLRLPFGLKNAPADFSRIMQNVLGDLKFVEVYLDDITVHSTDFQSHLKHLSIVFDRIRVADLRLNPSKCTWYATEIKILGHLVSNNRISMDPAKIDSVRDRLAPKNVKQLQQFLGLANYYRRFVKDFSKLAAPMFLLLKKEANFVWSKECNESFNALKEALISYPTLQQPHINKQFLLFTDASGYALGAILAQKDEDKNEYVCAYASRILNKHEMNYTISEKECLAVMFGIKQFRIYLNNGIKFKIITDHSALVWLMTIKDPNGRLARWSLCLQYFEFEIIHRKGSNHNNVDALSRPVLSVELVSDSN